MLPPLLALLVLGGYASTQRAIGETTAFATSQTFASINVKGDTLVAIVFWTGAGTPVTVGDNFGDLFRSPAPAAQGPDGGIQLFYAQAGQTGPNMVIATASGASSIGISLLEYCCLAQTATAGASQGATLSTSLASTPTLSGSQGDLVVAGVYDPGAAAARIQPGAGWNTEEVDAIASFLAMDQLASGGSVSPTATLPSADDTWVMTAARFSMGPGSTVPAPFDGGVVEVQFTGNAGLAASNSLPVTMPMPVTAGNTLVAVGAWEGAFGPGVVTDTLGNQFMALLQSPGSTEATVQLFYASEIDGGSDTLTLSTMTSSGPPLQIIAHEFAGMGATTVYLSANATTPHRSDVCASPTMTSRNGVTLAFAAFIEPGIGLNGALNWSSEQAAFSTLDYLDEYQTFPANGPLLAGATLGNPDDQCAMTVALFGLIAVQPVDAGSPDAGSRDGGSDAGASDAGLASASDASVPDASAPDGGARPVDAGITPAGLRANLGCSASAGTLALPLAALLVAGRRRRGPSASSRRG